MMNTHAKNYLFSAKHLFLPGCLVGLLTLASACKKEPVKNLTAKPNTAMLLSQDIDITGLRLCTQMPAPKSQPDGRHKRAIGDKRYLWEPGQSIQIYLMQQEPYKAANKLIEKYVKLFAAEWTDYANIQFKYVDSAEESDVRIGFKKHGGDMSYIGTFGKDIPRDQHTMNLDFSPETELTDLKARVLHEFGHMLGLHHEHLHPSEPIMWNKPMVYAYYQKTQGWDQQQVDNNVLNPLNKAALEYSAYDPLSIMHYYIDPRLTLNNQKVEFPLVLSDTDKKFIAQIYPK